MLIIRKHQENIQQENIANIALSHSFTSAIANQIHELTHYSECT